MIFKSKEEQYFSWYLDELKKEGFVSEYWYEPETFVLSEKVVEKFKSIKHLKNKTKEEIKEKTILNGHVYTPDFKILFKEIPYFLKDKYRIVDNIWWVDVKGTFNRHGGDRVFPINAKWLYQKHSILVEKIIPEELFKKTFTPLFYFKTDVSKKERKQKWNFIQIQNILKK